MFSLKFDAMVVQHVQTWDRPGLCSVMLIRSSIPHVANHQVIYQRLHYIFVTYCNVFLGLTCRWWILRGFFDDSSVNRLVYESNRFPPFCCLPKRNPPWVPTRFHVSAPDSRWNILATPTNGDAPGWLIRRHHSVPSCKHTKRNVDNLSCVDSVDHFACGKQLSFFHIYVRNSPTNHTTNPKFVIHLL